MGSLFHPRTALRSTVVMLAALTARPVLAAPQLADLTACSKGPAEIALSACDRVLKEYRQKEFMGVPFLRFRRDWLREAGKFDKAMADAQAILRSKYAIVDDWNERGIIFYQQGDFGRAETDFVKASAGKPDNTVYIANIAQVQLEAGRYEASYETYSRLVKTDSHNAEWRNGRGLATARMGRATDALPDLDFAANTQKTNGTYWYQYGYYLSIAGRDKLAIAAFDKAISFAPDDASMYVARGMSEQGLGEYVAALKDYDKAMRLGDAATAPFYRVSALIESGDLTKAELRLNQLPLTKVSADDANLLRVKLLVYQDRLKDAERLATRLLKQQSTRTDVRNWLAAAQLNSGSYEKAIRNFTAVISDWPNDGWAHIDRARAYHETGKQKDAYADLAAALAIPSSAALARERRVQYLADEGRWLDAIADLDVLVSNAPDNARYRVDRGNAKWNILSLGAAQDDFKEAARLAPDDADVLAQLAALQADLGEEDDAKATLTKVLALKPSGAEVFRHMGWAHESLADFSAAVADHTHAIAASPRDASLYAARAMARIAQRDLTGAMSDCKMMQPLAFDPASPETCLARVWDASGDAKQAAAAYNRAITADSNWGFPHFELGRLLADGADYQAAAEQFSESIRLNYAVGPSYSWRGRMLEYLDLPELAAKSYQEAEKLGSDPVKQDAARGLTRLRHITGDGVRQGDVHPQEKSHR